MYWPACLATCCTEHSDNQQITDVPTVAGPRPHGQVAAVVMVGDVLSYDGEDMLWMQLVKVGIVFVRAKAPAWAQPRPSHWVRDSMVKWLQIVMVGDVLSYDGDDMLWMQLVKVGNVFDRAKAPAWSQPRPSHWTTMLLWERRRRRRVGDDMM